VTDPTLLVRVVNKISELERDASPAIDPIPLAGMVNEISWLSQRDLLHHAHKVHGVESKARDSAELAGGSFSPRRQAAWGRDSLAGAIFHLEMTSSAKDSRPPPTAMQDDSGRPAQFGSVGARCLIVGLTTLAAVSLYLDRVCIAEILKYKDVREALELSDRQVSWTLSAFFWAYALAQVPMGRLADRWGARLMLALYLVGWSLATALGGAVQGLLTLLVLRAGVGVAQAGAFPASAGLLRAWIPFGARGLASSVVAWGGRFGGALAPWLTAVLIARFAGWQTVLVVYGLAGLVIALLVWVFVRDRPTMNTGSQGPVAPALSHSTPASSTAGLPAALVRSQSMWLMCLMQACTNIGWVFLITWLPTYLKEVRHVADETGGALTTIALVAGMLGMLIGGGLTDIAVRAAGLRWGRAAPLAATRLVAGFAYLACLVVEPIWAFMVLLAVVAICTDLGVGPTWAVMQDVGGEHTATVLGWGNMWGNFGAALAPPLIEWMNRTQDLNGDWHESFLLMATSFFVAGIASLGIRADQPLLPTPSEIGLN